MTSQEEYQKWQDAQNKYQQYVGGQQAFQEALKNQYNTKYNNNADLINQQNALASELYSMPTKMRAEYLGGPVRNPLEQESLISQRVGTAQNAVQNVRDLLTQRGTKFQDILNSAMGQWGSESDATRLSAEAAWNAYLQQSALEEAQRQRDFEAQQAALDRAASGGGSSYGSSTWPDISQYDTEPKLTPDQEKEIEIAAAAKESGWNPTKTYQTKSGSYWAEKPMSIAERNKKLQTPWYAKTASSVRNWLGLK